MMMLRSMLAMVGFVSWIAATPAAIAADEADARPIRRVLAVYENASTLPAAMEVAQGLRQALDKRFPMGVDIYAENLDIIRFPSPDHLSRLAADIAAKYKDVSFDAVMAVGPGALKFMLDNRSRIAADAPLIFGGISEGRPLPPG